MGTTLTKRILDEFVGARRNFVETGTFNGDGVDLALEHGFDRIYSIELSHDHYEYNHKRFMGHPEVHLFEGDSVDILPAILSSLQQPTVFWLDAHYGNTWALGKQYVPLVTEVDMICKHFLLKEHVLLIDDVRLFGVNYWQDTTMKAIEDILPVGSKYVFRDSNNFSNDIMVVRFE